MINSSKWLSVLGAAITEKRLTPETIDSCLSSLPPLRSGEMKVAILSEIGKALVAFIDRYSKETYEIGLESLEPLKNIFSEDRDSKIACAEDLRERIEVIDKLLEILTMAVREDAHIVELPNSRLAVRKDGAIVMIPDDNLHLPEQNRDIREPHRHTQEPLAIPLKQTARQMARSEALALAETLGNEDSEVAA